MSFTFKKAEREKVFVKLGLLGPSGSGKTYSALRMATGMAEELRAQGKKGSIAVADTEGRRALYYANEFDFLHLDFQPPYNPERYCEVIEDAVKAGVDILIIDSSSHEWIGPGGCLEIHNVMPGNSYANWNKVTPRHDKFVSMILRSPIHLICTIRGKDQYILQENEKGKQEPKKVGVGGQQRDGLEYELTSVLLMQLDTHIASSTKDNTHLFDGKYFMPTEDTGKALIQWASSGNVQQPIAIVGSEPPQAPPAASPPQSSSLRGNNGSAGQVTSEVSDLKWDSFWKSVGGMGFDEFYVHEFAKTAFNKPDLQSLKEVIKDQKQLNGFLGQLAKKKGAA